MYFTSMENPTHSVILNRCSTLSNLDQFIESHLTIVKANNGKETFTHYIERLSKAKEQIQSSLII